MMIRNFETWAAFIAERQTAPFVWGTQDCVTFAAGAAFALTGNDPLSGIASWDSEKTAMRALAKRGGLVSAVSSVLPEIPVAMAHRGDIGLVDGPDGPFLVVIEGLTVVGPGPEGLERLTRGVLLKAWSVTP